jgi:hypothetical protein
MPTPIIKVTQSTTQGSVVPIANTIVPGLVNTLSGNTTDVVTGANTCTNLTNAVQVDGYSLAQGVYTPNVISAPRPIYNVIEVFDEFTTYVPGSTTTGAIPSGTNNWYLTVTTAGASTNSVSLGADAFNKCVGVLECATAATANYVSYISLPTTYIVLGLGQLDIFFRVAFYGLPTGTTSAVFRFGIGDSFTTFANCTFLQMGWVTSAPQWITYAAKTSTSTTGATSTTPTLLAQSSSAATFYKCQVSINATASSVSYFVNGVQIGSAITTNIPTATLMTPFCMCANSTAAVANAFYIDKFYLRYLIAQ